MRAKPLVHHILWSGLLGKYRKKPALFAYFRTNAAEFLCSRDCVAEDAVMSEPLSAWNSLVTGINTRNSADLDAPLTGIEGRKPFICW